MNILYINVIELNAGWGAECFVNRAFLNEGHATQVLDYRKHRTELAARLLATDDFDVMLLQRGDGFPLELLAACHRPRFFWASELVSRCRDQDRLFQSGFFNHVFVRTPQCIEQVVRNGWMPRERMSVLLSGYDELTHRKMECRKDLEAVFVGTLTPRRKQIIERLQRKFPVTVVTALGSEMAEVFNRAKIVLNLHAEEFLDTETRIYEALGCGAFVLTERLSKESPFVSGMHLVEAEDLADLEEKLAYYLANKSERCRIVVQGHEEVAGHSYTARAKHLAAVMQSFLPASAPGFPPLDRTAVRLYAGRKGREETPPGSGSFWSSVPGKLRRMLFR